jgi:hypothetical protein
MLKRFKLYLKFRKEVDRVALRIEAVSWTKAYLKSHRVPNWTSEYQTMFPIYVQKYTEAYLHNYAKVRLSEQR